jgi:hypothetical protein
VVYGARLESGFTRKGIEGSNPSPSAKYRARLQRWVLYLAVNMDEKASASGAQPPVARRPWEPGWSKAKAESLSLDYFYLLLVVTTTLTGVETLVVGVAAGLVVAVVE